MLFAIKNKETIVIITIFVNNEFSNFFFLYIYNNAAAALGYGRIIIYLGHCSTFTIIIPLGWIKYSLLYRFSNKASIAMILLSQRVVLLLLHTYIKERRKKKKRLSVHQYIIIIMYNRRACSSVCMCVRNKTKVKEQREKKKFAAGKSKNYYYYTAKNLSLRYL